MRATSLEAPARFWIRARVCSTESCRCAAISARCSVRTSAVRCATAWRRSSRASGPTATAATAATTMTTRIHSQPAPGRSDVTASRKPSSTRPAPTKIRSASAPPTAAAPTGGSTNRLQATAARARATATGVVTASMLVVPSASTAKPESRTTADALQTRSRGTGTRRRTGPSASADPCSGVTAHSQR